MKFRKRQTYFNGVYFNMYSSIPNGNDWKSESWPPLVVTLTVLLQNTFRFFSRKKNPTQSAALNQANYHSHHNTLSVTALAAGSVKNQHSLVE